MAQNPFLPKSSIRWRTGPSAGKAGIPLLSNVLPSGSTQTSAANYKKSHRGRKPKKTDITPSLTGIPWWALPDCQGNLEAGQLGFEEDAFLAHNGNNTGTYIDMIPLAHGATGCSAHALTQRLNLSGFVQGIESFTALDACTDLKFDDLVDNGNAKLKRAIDEAVSLFPLTRGISIINESGIARIGTDITGIIKAKAKSSERLIISSSYGWARTTPTVLRAALPFANDIETGPHNIALAECGPAAHVWIIDKLMRDIGLNPIHVHTGSSRTDLSWAGRCKIVIAAHCFQPKEPKTFRPGSVAHTLSQQFNMPVFWGCFLSPDATDVSLRAIASHFDSEIQHRAEALIEVSRKKTDAIIARYRPRLEGKLFLNLWMADFGANLDVFRLLGMRVGNREGWPGKTGILRTPRLAWRWKDEKSLSAYLAEAKPDLAYIFGFEPSDWTKRGVGSIPFSPLRNRGFHFSCCYDGFAALAAALDRHINAPWRKLVKPPWPENSG